MDQALPSAHNVAVHHGLDCFIDCRAKCVMHGPECTHFTFQKEDGDNEEKGTCYLKNIDGMATEIMVSAPGFVSGPNFCARDSKYGSKFLKKILTSHFINVELFLSLSSLQTAMS